jgi:hypothetical protein
MRYCRNIEQHHNIKRTYRSSGNRKVFRFRRILSSTFSSSPLPCVLANPSMSPHHPLYSAMLSSIVSILVAVVILFAQCIQASSTINHDYPLIHPPFSDWQDKRDDSYNLDLLNEALVTTSTTTELEHTEASYPRIHHFRSAHDDSTTIYILRCLSMIFRMWIFLFLMFVISKQQQVRWKVGDAERTPQSRDVPQDVTENTRLVSNGPLVIIV